MQKIDKLKHKMIKTIAEQHKNLKWLINIEKSK